MLATVDAPSLASGHRFGRWLAVEIDPGAHEALEKACLLEQTGAGEEAIEVLGDALQEDGECTALCLARGALYLAAGYPRAAAGDFQRAVGLAANQPLPWFALGHAYEVLGLSRQALESLEHSVQLGFEGHEAELSIARVYRTLGRLGLAAQHYELALTELDPPPIDLLIEAAVLTTEDSTKAAGVEATRERLEACTGKELSDDAWLLRAVLPEIRGESPARVAETFHALEVRVDELSQLTRNLLIAQQLVDPETSAAALARVLSTAPDEAHRAALAHCLSRS